MKRKRMKRKNNHFIVCIHTSAHTELSYYSNNLVYQNLYIYFTYFPALKQNNEMHSISPLKIVILAKKCGASKA